MGFEEEACISVMISTLRSFVHPFLDVTACIALHSSSRFSKLCSGALSDGNIDRFTGLGRGGLATDPSDSAAASSFAICESPFFLIDADTLSFQILPSFRMDGSGNGH
jgi:hypothetical protein